MTSSTALLNKVQGLMIEFANQEGIDLRAEFGTVDAFKKFVVAFTIKTLTDMGIAIKDAFNIVMGSGQYESLAERVWNDARAQAAPIAATAQATEQPTGLKLYTPELGEQRPAAAQIDASLSHYGNHWHLKTPLELKGRGIEFLGKLQAANLTPKAKHKAGWNQYKVTQRAFELLEKKYLIASESLL